MKSFFAALKFLTILPVGISWAGGQKELERSIYSFPVVGLLIGGVIACVDIGLGYLFPPILQAAFTAIAMIGISGGLHLDGLADTADGFFSSRSREQILTIMKDSRIGAMGVIALVCSISLKIAALYSLPSCLRWQTILLMPLAGRCAMIVKIAVLPYARPEGGLASVFCKCRSWTNSVWPFLFVACAAWLLAECVGLCMAVSSLVVTLAFALYTYQKIGGLTGDTLGACCEIVELVPALTVIALMSYGFAA